MKLRLRKKAPQIWGNIIQKHIEDVPKNLDIIKKELREIQTGNPFLKSSHSTVLYDLYRELDFILRPLISFQNIHRTTMLVTTDDQGEAILDPDTQEPVFTRQPNPDLDNQKNNSRYWIKYWLNIFNTETNLHSHKGSYAGSLWIEPGQSVTVFPDVHEEIENKTGLLLLSDSQNVHYLKKHQYEKNEMADESISIGFEVYNMEYFERENIDISDYKDFDLMPLI